MDVHGKTIACWQIKIQTGVLIMKGTSNGIFMKHQIQVFAQRGKMSRISKVSEKRLIILSSNVHTCMLLTSVNHENIITLNPTQ